MQFEAQSAMEYLTTYGWVLLVIGIALAALFALGIFNSGTYVSNICTLPAQFECISAFVSTTGLLSISLKQNTPDPITVNAIYCNINDSVPNTISNITPVYLGVGGNASFTIPCYTSSGAQFSGSIGSVYHGFVIINYTDIPTSFSYTTYGTLVQKISRYTTSTTTSTSTTSTTSTSTTSTSTTSTSTTSTSTTTVHYVPITLTNSQSSATPSPFQQMIVVDSGTYSYYMDSNWDNVEFTTGADGTGTALQAWIEANASYGSHATVVWVKLTSSISGSGGTQTIYMDFMPSPVLSSSGPTGEAPQLSSPYGQYDNGGSVFPYYQAFGGLSSLPSGWSSSTTFWTFNPKNTTFTSSSRSGIWMTLPSSLSSYPYVWDFYGNMYITTSTPGTYIGGYGSSPGSLCCNIEYSLLEGYGHTPPTVYIVSDNNGQYFSTSMSDTNTSKVYTFWASSSGTAGAYLNYQGSYSATGITPTTPGYFMATTASGSILTLYWLRTRAYPPNGMMPSVAFGSLV